MYKFSEYVSPGHPDKCADYISEYILDRYIEKDPNVRYAMEVMIKDNTVYLAGEVTSIVRFTHEEYVCFVADALREIGYTEDYYKKWGRGNVINPSYVTVVENISAQSPEIAQGVDNDGWGDQGIFFGYADVDGDKTMMPLSHALAKNLCHMLYNQSLMYDIGGIDIKTEVILDENNKLRKVIAAVPCRTSAEYREVLNSIFRWIDDKPGEPEITLNGTGNYVMHGPIADCGVTGRKLAVDFYGGEFQVGGGSPWTKDASKADLALNLYARKRAVEYAKRTGQSVKVSLACCIGSSKICYSVNTPCGDEIVSGYEVFSPDELKKEFRLDEPNYTSMCTFGLFGEYQTDKVWENE